MKKIGLFLLIMFCIFITGCESNEVKEVNSFDNFEAIATSAGFKVENNIGNYATAPYITEAMIATYENNAIEMVIYNSEDNAIRAQESQIDSFVKIKSTGAAQNKEKGQNYYKFWMVSNGYYMVSSRIDNTLIFSKTLLRNKEKVEKVFEEMGY